MNAEVFQSDEYVVRFERVCNLRKRDCILYRGKWKEVFFLNSEVVRFHDKGLKGTNIVQLPKKSQQMFQFIKS